MPSARLDKTNVLAAEFGVWRCITMFIGILPFDLFDYQDKPIKQINNKKSFHLQEIQAVRAALEYHPFLSGHVVLQHPE